MSPKPKLNQPKYYPIQEETNDPKQQKVDPNEQETIKPFKYDWPCITTSLVFVASIISIIWLSIKSLIFAIILCSSNIPEFHVDNVTLTQFELSPKNNILHYNLAVNMTFRNPNDQLGIQYDTIKVDAIYHGQRFMTKHVQGFYLGHKKENNNVNAFFNGERLIELINGDEKVLYESESKDGVYEVDLMLLLRMRFTTLSRDTDKFVSKVACHLKVPLSSQGKGLSERTPCVYKKIGYYDDNKKIGYYDVK